ncbi:MULTISPECIES: FxsB family cyclophane-forming radical SAM/SPASM peptide maturase [Actinoalloteichus]|uniref:FxsB family cyclophane-forming radical SAM/SPASM peptide maturase n=1 Tax=Actinoalloteichus TaxID=65496 RepID=UPI0004283FF3|nr:FxsB family cyclophane-forming radical SAM/SPASM peptide maturase [Actinoalloteichus caeruleus]
MTAGSGGEPRRAGGDDRPGSGREWPGGLDVAGLRERGQPRLPFSRFVLKVHGRCNLACDYCYLYEMADTSWRRTPAVMSQETVRVVADRVAEHARRHDLADVRITLHGGEPLLVGPVALDRVLRVLRASVEPVARIGFAIQTNGVLLTDEVVGVLAEHRVRVGVSLDGGADAHDRHRRRRGGGGSHAAAAAGIRRLTAAHPELFAGLLAVVDLDNDPVEVYEHLLSYSPPAVDFLLPHGNWTTPPPPGRVPDGNYARWLMAVYDRWYGAPRRETRVRLFEELVNLLLGGRSRSEAVGLAPVAFVVVDTDGSLEQVDSLRSAFDGAAATGLTVADGLEEAMDHPAVVARQLGLAGLSPTCRSCPVVAVCGGGLYAHRYRAGEGFLNPSVYCADLRILVDHVSRRVRADLARLRAGAR